MWVKSCHPKCSRSWCVRFGPASMLSIVAARKPGSLQVSGCLPTQERPRGELAHSSAHGHQVEKLHNPPNWQVLFPQNAGSGALCWRKSKSGCRGDSGTAFLSLYRVPADRERRRRLIASKLLCWVWGVFYASLEKKIIFLQLLFPLRGKTGHEASPGRRSSSRMLPSRGKELRDLIW